MRNTRRVPYLTACTNVRSLLTPAGVTRFDNLDLCTTYLPALNPAAYLRQLHAEVAR